LLLSIGGARSLGVNPATLLRYSGGIRRSPIAIHSGLQGGANPLEIPADASGEA
jgi:hypothetical protein